MTTNDDTGAPQPHPGNLPAAGGIDQSSVFAASDPFVDARTQSWLGVDVLAMSEPTPQFGQPAEALPRPVSCMDVHQNLSIFLDGELTVLQQQAFAEHLAMCPPCQTAQAFQMQLRTTIAAKAIDPTPADVRDRITRALGFDLG